MNVAYLGPLKDYSGYGEANRHFVAALDTAGVNVIPQLVTYSHETSDFGALGARIEPMFDRKGDYRIKILHTTPNAFKKHMEPGKYHIGHFFWETDRVPDDFVKGLQLCDEIWTGSEANKQALLSTGVDKPVYIIPQAIDMDRAPVEPYVLPDFDGFLFYSIFEWTDRKNPAALLKAYWEEFQDDENVGLLIKTYFHNFQLGNKRMIRHQVEHMKRRSGLDKFPPVFLYLDLMDRVQLERIHETGDVYVSAHRGEGWGVPQVEAATHGKPMISTAYGGCHEYFEDGKNAMLLPYEMVPVTGMEHSHNWYTREQKWADVDHAALRAALRSAYEDKLATQKMGARAKGFVTTAFSFQHVGRLMADRLKQIEEGL
jgi:glycosyltransferase involved in cell wall biosynthesis